MMRVSGEDVFLHLISPIEEAGEDEGIKIAHERVDVSLDRLERGLHPPSFVKLLERMENLDEVEFQIEEED